MTNAARVRHHLPSRRTPRSLLVTWCTLADLVSDGRKRAERKSGCMDTSPVALPGIRERSGRRGLARSARGLGLLEPLERTDRDWTV